MFAEVALLHVEETPSTLWSLQLIKEECIQPATPILLISVRGAIRGPRPARHMSSHTDAPQRSTSSISSSS